MEKTLTIKSSDDGTSNCCSKSITTLIRKHSMVVRTLFTAKQTERDDDKPAQVDETVGCEVATHGRNSQSREELFF